MTRWAPAAVVAVVRAVVSRPALMRHQCDPSCRTEASTGSGKGAVQLVEVIPDRFTGSGVIARLALRVGAAEKPHFRGSAG